MIERMRPMSEAPRDGTAVTLWWVWRNFAPDVCRWDEQSKAWERAGDHREWADDLFIGWTPIVRPLEPEAPEPDPAPILPPTPQRLRLQIRSAAQESVALGQGVGEFVAMAKLAHGEATKRKEGGR